MRIFCLRLIKLKVKSREKKTSANLLDFLSTCFINILGEACDPALAIVTKDHWFITVGVAEKANLVFTTLETAILV